MSTLFLIDTLRKGLNPQSSAEESIKRVLLDHWTKDPIVNFNSTDVGLFCSQFRGERLAWGVERYYLRSLRCKTVKRIPATHSFTTEPLPLFFSSILQQHFPVLHFYLWFWTFFFPYLPISPHYCSALGDVSFCLPPVIIFSTRLFLYSSLSRFLLPLVIFLSAFPVFSVFYSLSLTALLLYCYVLKIN